MAKTRWTKAKANANAINNGNEYTTDDNLTINELNAIVNNSLYATQVAEEAKEKANSAFEANGTLVKVNGVTQSTWSADFVENEKTLSGTNNANPIIHKNYLDKQVSAIQNKINETNSDLSEISNTINNHTKAISNLETDVATLQENEFKTTSTLIFDTSTRTTGTYSFLDDINNYNLLIFCGYETEGNSYTYVTTTVDAFKRTDSTYQMQIANNNVSANRYMKLYYSSDTSFIITAFGKFNFRRVYGIK